MARTAERLERLEQAAGVGAAMFYVVEAPAGVADQDARVDAALAAAGHAPAPRDTVVVLQMLAADRPARVVNAFRV